MAAEAFFFVIAGLLIVASLLVVFRRDVVHSAMALVAVLFLTAILFVILRAPMVGILQVLVYAGAVMVLFLFVIMFLNPAGVEQRRRGARGIATVSAGLLGLVLIASVTVRAPLPEPADAGDLFGSPEYLARALFDEFVLPFEIASLLLLVAIVGAVVLAKRER